jgi:NAD(P)-dependent dehydrogenase (short-subunit alcohol dehydrogenase family)
MAGRLENRIALITGGASGIGRGCALCFAREGADVVIADIKAGDGAEVLEAIERLGRRALYVRTDTSREADVEALASRVVEEFGRIDVLVAAAGVSHAGYVSGAEQDRTGRDPTAGFVINKPVADWERVLAVNLTGVMLTDRAVAKKMIEAGTAGSIINIASGAAKLPLPGAADYCVSKAGVWMLTKTLAVELGPQGIRVNAIGPGLIETPMTEALTKDPAAVQAFQARTPLGRLGRPDDIANTALFLASDESSYFTGQILHPDGGLFTG